MPRISFQRYFEFFIQSRFIKKPAVDIRIFPAGLGPAVKILQFDGNNGGLQGVQSKIPADNLVIILGMRPMGSQNT